MWVWEGGGDGASTKWWASLVTYEGISNVIEEVEKMSVVRTQIGLSFGTLNIQAKKTNISTCKKLRSKKIEMQTNKLEANIKIKHTTNRNSASPSSRGRNKNGSLLWGNLPGSVLMLRLTHKEERLEDVNVHLEHHNMALNGMASNEWTP